MRKIISSLFFIITIFLINIGGCGGNGGDTQSTVPESTSEIEFDEQDDNGNLLIINYSDKPLVLYKGQERKKIIPDDSEDYLVNIPNQNQNTVDLKIYEYYAVKDNLDDPNDEFLFKRWNVVLSSDNEEEHRVTWFIQPDAIEKESGLVTISYVGGTANSVDIFLNGHSGAKIVSLNPGQYVKKIGIDYGNYTVHYRYWYSDQNTPDGAIEIGWIDTEIINQNEVEIFLVLNAYRSNRHIQIPHWNGGQPSDNQYGNIRIENKTSNPLQIWVGSKLIEHVMYTDQPIENFSTIASNEYIIYTLQIENYTFIAKSLDSVQEIDRIVANIESNKELSWIIE